MRQDAAGMHLAFARDAQSHPMLSRNIVARQKKRDNEHLKKTVHMYVGQ
jgi:hypothetical protein